MNPTTPTPTLTLEKDLAAMLAVSRETLAEARKKLVEGDDWMRQQNAIAYTDAGMQKIAAALGLQRPPLGAEEKKGAEVRTVFVKRLARRNTRILFCTESDAGRAKKGGYEEELVVRVRDAKMFVIGQEIKVRDAGGALILHGKQPTRRGRA